MDMMQGGLGALASPQQMPRAQQPAPQMQPQMQQMPQQPPQFAPPQPEGIGLNLVRVQDKLKDLSDSQLLNYLQTGGSAPPALVLAELNRRKRMRSGMDMPEGTSVAEELAMETAMGLAAVPTQEYADGGLVSFADGGSVLTPEQQARILAAPTAREKVELMLEYGVDPSIISELPVIPPDARQLLDQRRTGLSPEELAVEPPASLLYAAPETVGPPMAPPQGQLLAAQPETIGPPAPPPPPPAPATMPPDPYSGLVSDGLTSRFDNQGLREMYASGELPATERAFGRLQGDISPSQAFGAALSVPSAFTSDIAQGINLPDIRGVGRDFWYGLTGRGEDPELRRLIESQEDQPALGVDERFADVPPARVEPPRQETTREDRGDRPDDIDITNDQDRERAIGALAEAERKGINWPLVMAGLGMMASERPDFLGALGEGGIAGILQKLKQDEAAAAREEKALDRALKEREVAARERAASIPRPPNTAQLNYMRKQLEESLMAYGLTMQQLEAYRRGDDSMFYTSGLFGRRKPVEGADALETLLDNELMPRYNQLRQLEAAAGLGMGGIPFGESDETEFEGFEDITRRR